MIGAEILDSVGADIDKCYQNEDWNALQFTSSTGDAEIVKTLLSDGAKADCQCKVMLCSCIVARTYPHVKFHAEQGPPAGDAAAHRMSIRAPRGCQSAYYTRRPK
jgi:hypothetical protein